MDIAEGVDQDAYGNGITNSAGDGFSSPASKNFTAGVLRCLRNEPYYNIGQAVDYQNTVNSDNATFFAGVIVLEKGQCLCRKIRPTTPITHKSLYVTVEYTFEFRRGRVQDSDGYWDPFKYRVMDAGQAGFWNDSGTTRRGNFGSITLGGVFENVPTDVRLDGTGIPMESTIKVAAKTGGAAAVANPTSLPAECVIETTANAKFLKWHIYRVKNHNLLGL
jgi:hypothetical protein